jgi:hypothetical protein
MKHDIQLPTGLLHVRIDHCSLPLDQLCGFAGRNNPKRGFLFVSKVLGKHVACSAAQMSEAHRLLAEQIDPAVLADALVIGMAETATGLGHGVYEACLTRADGVAPALYLQSTRYPLAGAQSVDFEEKHSHAVQQRLYLPADPALRARFDAAHSVILVDDEISTGQTLANLVTSLRQQNPRITQVVLVCLTDFSEGRAQANLLHVDGITSVQTVALLHGRFDFEFAADFVQRLASAPPAPAFAAMSCRRDWIAPAWSARQGVCGAMALPEALVDASVALCKTGVMGRVLVLGTGEFMHLAYLLARDLTRHGIEAVVQSTSRSPILVGVDIKHVMEVPDAYGEGIPNYLYNVDPSQYAQIFVVHETPRNAELLALCARLGAHAVSLSDAQVCAAAQLSAQVSCT